MTIVPTGSGRGQAPKGLLCSLPPVSAHKVIGSGGRCPMISCGQSQRRAQQAQAVLLRKLVEAWLHAFVSAEPYVSHAVCLVSPTPQPDRIRGEPGGAGLGPDTIYQRVSTDLWPWQARSQRDPSTEQIRDKEHAGGDQPGPENAPATSRSARTSIESATSAAPRARCRADSTGSIPVVVSPGAGGQVTMIVVRRMLTCRPW